MATSVALESRDRALSDRDRIERELECGGMAVACPADELQLTR